MTARAHASLPGLFGLGYVIWRPVTAGEVLYPVLALVALLSLVDALRFRNRVAPQFQLAGFLILLSSVIGLFVGSLKDTPGLTHQGAVIIGGFTIWALWAATLDAESIRKILGTIAVAILILSGSIVVYIATESGYLPKLLPAAIISGQDASFDDADGTTAIRFAGLSSLAAGGPLMAGAAMAPRSKYLPNKRLLLITAICAAVAAVLAGRRAIALVTVLSPVLYLSIRLLLGDRSTTPVLRRRIPRLAVLAFPILPLGALVSITSSPARQIISAAGEATSVFLPWLSDAEVMPENALRLEQASQLTSGWSDNIVFGAGLGGTLGSGYERSVNRPWMFELQYHQLLFSLGLLGLLILVVAAFAAWSGLRRAARVSPDATAAVAAVTVGAVSLLVANASNPYLQAVGHQWGIALAFGVANAILMGSDGLTSSTDSHEPNRA